MRDTGTGARVSPQAAGPPSRAGLWFSLLGGASAWTVHILLAYLIAEFACIAEVDRYMWLGIAVPAWMLIVMSVLMLAVSIAATLAGKRNVTTRSLVVELYMARTGYLMSALFTLIILVQSVPTFFYLQQC